MQIGVIGAGNWGRNIIQTLAKLEALGAVAEVREDLRARTAAEQPGVAVHDDYRVLLASPLPAVAVATPAPTHYQFVKEALSAGKDVFVEKPMTLKEAEALELASLAAAQGRILMVGHMLLYQPAIVWLKEYLAGGKLGEIWSLHQERLNLGRARAVENALWSLGVHDVAVLLHLIGSAPVGLQVTGQCALQAAVEDDVYLHLEFAGGVRAHLHNAWLWPERRRRLTVVGSLGMLVYDELEQSVTLHRKGIGADLTNRDEGAEVVFQGAGEPLALEMEHFLACLAARRQPLSDGAEGARVVGVLEQATNLLRQAAAKE